MDEVLGSISIIVTLLVIVFILVCIVVKGEDD